MKIEALTPPRGTPLAVAIVGLHGRFPAAKDVNAFWLNLRNGTDPIADVPDTRWRHQDIFGEPDGTAERTYATTGGFAPDVDAFDCRFFNITPREAESMDPQQRLFLQTSWAALEDAGIAPGKLAGRSVGVFVGVGHADYPVLMRRDHAPFDVFRGTGIVPTAIANRVSFSLDLRGPSEIVDTACSGSLVAIHRATQALTLGECELAIAGGVNLLLGPELFIAFAKAGMLSRTGRCRPFDRGGDGYVRGEGVAAVVLKPLHLAESDGDFIYGTIRGSAENHGGRAHSFTAPSVAAQSDVVSRAWLRAGLSMREACLIETHGTGTRLGDPIEIKGLTKALERDAGLRVRDEGARIALGALKSNIGHLEAAAGVAGVIKALLAMHHQLIPANLNFESLNPEIDLSATPFEIPVAPIDVSESAPTKALTAGVSSFGFGGSNAHIVLEAPSESQRGDHEVEESEEPRLIVISARDEGALLSRVDQLVQYLSRCSPGSQDAARLDAFIGEVFGLGVPASACEFVRLAALNLSIGDLTRKLAQISAYVRKPISIDDIRDCVTVGEFSARIDAIAPHAIDRGTSQTQEATHLLSEVAVPDHVLRRTTLAAISCTLLHGREHMEERVAFIADSKEALRSKLEKFLVAPQAEDGGWHRGSVRRGATSATPRPAVSEPQGLRRTLSDWARYWASSPGAAVAWEDLHATPRPRKSPLPAYPFALTRIWYQAASQSSASADLPAAPNPIKIPKSGREGEQSHRRPSPTSNALAALSAVIAHLNRRSNGKSVRLSELEFGPPLRQPFGEFAIRESQQGGGLIQCVADRNGMTRVAVQGRAAVGGRVRSQNISKLNSDALKSNAAEFCELARDCGISIDGISNLVGGVWRGSDVVEIKLWHSETEAQRSGSLELPILTLVTAAAAILLRSAEAQELVPSRIAHLEIDGLALQTPLTLRVQSDGASARAEVIGNSSHNSRPGLVLQGLKLRRCDARHVSSSRVAASLAAGGCSAS